jgi:hypothetical protein
MTVTLDGSAAAESRSPFAGLSTVAEPEATGYEEPGHEAAGTTTAVSVEAPFAGFATDLPDREAEAEADLLEALRDEDFDDALANLVDEAAARHVAEQGSWSAQLSESEALGQLEGWVEPLAEAAERAIDRIAEGLEAARPETMSGTALEQLLAELAVMPPLEPEGFDHFLGGLLKKVTTFAGNAVKAVGKAATAVGKVAAKLGLGPLLKKLGGLVRPLLKQVLKMAIGRLPAAVRPIATSLAAKMGIREAEADGVTALSEAFDREATALLTAPDTAAVGEWEAGGHEAFEAWAESWAGSPTESWTRESPDPVGELDRARARLARQLTTLPPGSSGGPEIQQFLPALLAIQPLLKIGISFIGRDKVVKFLADRIAGLVKGLIGAEAAKLLVPAVVDVGMSAVGLEAPPDHEAGHPPPAEALSGEALASTVEGTVVRTLELLSPEAFGDQLALESAVQTAFAEAAAAYLPDRLLRKDLPQRETAGEGGIWVLMPRRLRPHRYRKFSQVYVVPVTRQMARAVRWSDGGTLESRLLDRGAPRWPVTAEVHLYEALPGTQLGHLTQDETTLDGERPDAVEYQPLTPDVAGLLLGEPALGRPVSRPATAMGAPVLGRARPQSGARYFRVRPVGPRGRQRALAGAHRRRLVVGLDLTQGRLRVVIRLSERQAQELLTKLQPADPSATRDLAAVLATLRAQYTPLLTGALTQRLLRGAIVPDAAAAGSVGERVTEAVTTALSAFLGEQAAALATAVKDPAAGVTVTVTFAGVTRAGLLQPLPAGQVTLNPGWRVHA